MDDDLSDKLIQMLNNPEFSNQIVEARKDGPLRITIPKQVAEMNNIEKGDRLRVQILEHEKEGDD